MTDLERAAAFAGLQDPDLLRIAKPGLPPVVAVADLKRRYPTAFAGGGLRIADPGEVPADDPHDAAANALSRACVVRDGLMQKAAHGRGVTADQFKDAEIAVREAECRALTARRSLPNGNPK